MFDENLIEMIVTIITAILAAWAAYKAHKAETIVEKIDGKTNGTKK